MIEKVCINCRLELGDSYFQLKSKGEVFAFLCDACGDGGTCAQERAESAEPKIGVGNSCCRGGEQC